MTFHYLVYLVVEKRGPRDRPVLAQRARRLEHLVVHYIALHYAAHYSTRPAGVSTTWHYITLHHITLHYIVPRYIALHDSLNAAQRPNDLTRVARQRHRARHVRRATQTSHLTTRSTMTWALLARQLPPRRRGGAGLGSALTSQLERGRDAVSDTDTTPRHAATPPRGGREEARTRAEQRDTRDGRGRGVRGRTTPHGITTAPASTTHTQYTRRTS